MNKPAPIFIRKCDKCGEPRMLQVSAMERNEGGAEWTPFSHTDVACGCGPSLADERDLEALENAPSKPAPDESQRDDSFRVFQTPPRVWPEMPGPKVKGVGNVSPRKPRRPYEPSPE